MILCISVLSVVISPFSFLILLIWFFPLCLLMSLANGLLILFIFSKNQLLAWLIFAMVSVVSFTFISALIFKISFLLLTLGFLISSFTSCFGYRVGLFIWLFLVSWGKPALLWTFPLAVLLQCPTGLGLLCFHFHSFLCVFCFLFDFFCDLLVIQQRVVQPPNVGIFNRFSAVLRSNLTALWSEKMLGMISIFLKSLSLLLCYC